MHKKDKILHMLINSLSIEAVILLKIKIKCFYPIKKKLNININREMIVLSKFNITAYRIRI